ncbi:hypothetical protein BGZ65_012300 [Modicella reniformis]|uniref:Uncharacterized protein n=1 Tax=Modicella reniformis TaxID=1440133 RepID=A0A9P6MCI2_9FUNG|nr:hypothetical protein BGZ65_012300 [Modicella reniformis]
MAPNESFLELIKHSTDGVLIFDNYDQLIAGKNEGIHKVPLTIGTIRMSPSDSFQRYMVVIGSGLYTIDGKNPNGVHEAEGTFGADYRWACSTQYIAKAYAATGAPVYQFQFQKGYNSDDICHNHVCHGDDVAIVFQVSLS